MASNFDVFIDGMDVLNRIVSFLGNVNDVHSLALSSKDLHIHLMKREKFEEIFMVNLEKIVKRFGFLDLLAFNHFIDSHDLVLSGSTVLSTLTGNVNWNQSDLDLYTAKKLTFHLVQDLSESIGFKNHIGFRRNGRYNGERCNSFENGSGLKIDIVTCTESVEAVIDKFDLPFLKNMYNGKGILRCLFPKTIIEKKCDYSLDLRVMCYSVITSKGISSSALRNYLWKKQDRVRKYERRGFIIVGGSIPSASIVLQTRSISEELKQHRYHMDFLKKPVAAKLASIFKK
jgi:hypothetical protein